MSALFLHGCIGCTLFHPVEWHLKENINKQSTKLQLLSKENDCKKTETCDNRDIQIRRRRTISQCSYANTDYAIASSVLDISGIGVLAIDESIASSKSEIYILESVRKFLGLIVRIAKKTIIDLAIIKRSKVALIITIDGCFRSICALNFMAIVPFAMSAKEYSFSEISTSMSICSLGIFVTRMTASTLSDFSWFNMRTSYMTGIIVLTSSTIGISMRDL